MHRNLGIGSWITRRARMTPQRVALVFGSQRITYQGLHERVTALAHALRQRGVGEGDRVAFLGYNHPAALELLFACGLLGAVFVPLHPGFDDQALRRALSVSAPRVLVCTPELGSAVERMGALVELPLRVTTGGLPASGAEPYEQLIAEASDEPIDRPIGLEHTCLLAFSSGTTGASKGVPLTHGNLLFNAVNMLSCYDYVRDDVLLASAPLYRMGGLGFVLALLFKGGTCVLQERADAARSLSLLQEHAVTILFDAVGALDALQAEPSFATARLSSLRICVSGGSYVPPRLVEAFRRHGLRLQPGYGLTEAAPLALAVDRDEVHAHPGASGRPPLYLAARVVDAELEDVAVGRTGELLVHGPNVMSGYLDDPEATARAFVEDGWLRTGDAARIAADGMISVVGRLADALVLGGERILPEPVEDALRALPGVRDCALVQHAPETLPVLYVVAAEQAPLDHARVRAAARAQLGLASAPELRTVAELPKNPNGKLLRRRLASLSAAPTAHVA